MPVAPLRCPLCAGMIQVDSDWAGRQVACPLCRGEFVVPPQPLAAIAAPPASVVPPPPPSPATSGAAAADDTADLLPPGVSVIAATSAETADELLPPRGGSSTLSDAAAPTGPVASERFVPISITVKAGGTPAPRRPPPPGAAIHRLMPKERAQRRLVKNAILFGVCIVTLVVVFYLLAR
jgi:hypothetical protein